MNFLHSILELLPSWILAVPVVSAMIYSLAVIFLKRCVDHGIGPWRTAFVTNWIMFLIFLPFIPQWLLIPIQSSHLLWIIAAGILFFLGQIFTFQAFSRGDVSLATPLMGMKMIFVPMILGIFLDQPVPPLWWLAAIIALGSLFCLQTNWHQAPRHVWQTLIFAMLSSLSFAATDIVIQEHAAKVGSLRFACWMFFCVALLSCSLIPFFKEKITSISWSLLRILLIGSVMLATQATLLFWALSQHGDATAINILYASRGLWSVLLVGYFATSLNLSEKSLPKSLLMLRLLGALLMLIAISLVFTQTHKPS